MENKVKKPKAVPVGPTVMLDAERCVLCSRCVRFCDEITGTNELGIVNRGDHAEITIAPDTELNNKYSGNVVDICPVGALTDRDFRFKCRVWFLETSPSVCPGCSMGCNIEIHWNKQRPYQTPGERVMRIKPRFNEAVNKWWVCDEGRYGYRFIDKDRILKPLKRVDGSLQETSWDEAIEQAALLLSQTKGVGVIASTNLTNEDLWIVKEIFEKQLPVQTMAYAWTKKPGYQDQFLIKSDKSPNTRGAQALGFQNKAQEIFSAALKGQIKTLILFGHNLIELLGKDTADRIRSNVENIMIIGSNRHEGLSLSNWVLPSTVYAEKDGTFINVQGRVQRIFRTFASLGEAREEWEILKMLGQKMGFKLDFQNSRAIFQIIAQSVHAFQGMSYEKLGSMGLTLNEEKKDPVGAHVG
jgi:NADH-quinone oxidoreductase subunit G